MRINNEPAYATFYHIEGIRISDIVSVEMRGDVQISYTGFGNKGDSLSNILFIFVMLVHKT